MFMSQRNTEDFHDYSQNQTCDNYRNNENRYNFFLDAKEHTIYTNDFHKPFKVNTKTSYRYFSDPRSIEYDTHKR